MDMSSLWGLLILFGIGVIGWRVFQVLRVPNAPMLGAIFVIGALRASGVELPNPPASFSQVTQMLLGFVIGSMITKETLRQIRKLFPPAALIMSWALVFAFAVGVLLARISSLDLLTTVLSASTGGLPEMTVLAMETSANAPVVIFMQIFRVVSVVISYPLLIRWILKRSEGLELAGAQPPGESGQAPANRVVNMVVAGGLALLGSQIFVALGVPAGAMLGSMCFVVIAEMLGYGVIVTSNALLVVVRIGVGIMAANGINPAIVQTLLSGELLLPLVLFTVLAYVGSFLLALVIRGITRWDWVTCLLAAAPAGVSAMALIAMESRRDPVRITILHVCRVLALKTVIPLAVMFFF